jgi:inner membrane protein
LKKEKIIRLEKKSEKKLINDNKSLLDLAILQEKKQIEIRFIKLRTEWNQKNIIELEEKVSNYKPKTNLMISEYKKLQKLKIDHIGNITYSWQ